MNRGFRLATVERLRAHGLERAARELGTARGVMMAAESAVTAKHAEIAACMPDVTCGPSSVTALAHRRELLREHAERLTTEAEAARAGLAEALACWQSSRSALKAVEGLHDRHRLALVEHDARHEQRLSDDLAVVAAFPRRRGGMPHGRHQSTFDDQGGDAA